MPTTIIEKDSQNKNIASKNKLSPICDILYINCKQDNLLNFKKLIGDKYNCFLEYNSRKAFSTFKKHISSIGIVICDISFKEKDNNNNGIKLLKNIKKINQNTIRVLTTGAYNDSELLLQAINISKIDYLIKKPWNTRNLLSKIHLFAKEYTKRINQENIIGKKIFTVKQIFSENKANSWNILAEGLNHHLRNALTPIKYYIELNPMMLKNALNNDIDLEYWQDAQKNAMAKIKKIQYLLEKLWETSFNYQQKLNNKINFYEIINQITLKYHKQFDDKKILFEKTIDKNIEIIKSNKNCIIQLISLLLDESLSQLEENQKVEISILNENIDETKGVKITIKDNGNPPDIEQIMHIFDPFYVRNSIPSELGINLPASLAIVHQLKGLIWPEYLPDNGLKIIIWLPVNPKNSLNNKFLNLKNFNY